FGYSPPNPTPTDSASNPPSLPRPAAPAPARPPAGSPHRPVRCPSWQFLLWIVGGLPRTLPGGADARGGNRRHIKSYELRGNLETTAKQRLTCRLQPTSRASHRGRQ